MCQLVPLHILYGLPGIALVRLLHPLAALLDMLRRETGLLGLF